MSDLPDLSQAPDERRCPSCDTVVAADATVCLMCGIRLTPVSTSHPKAAEAPEPAPVSVPQLEPDPMPEPAVEDEATAVSPDLTPEIATFKRVAPAATTAVTEAPEVVESVMRERQTPLVLALTAVFFAIIVVIGGLILQYQG
ncbi:MAG: hypothetical protein KC434_14190, partial [Anaerolineales bacterium]|nr:hypothetical protein [Anaerolineales bacterium]